MHERLVSVGSRGVRVRRLGGSRAGEIRITRFLRNPAVNVEEMIETASARTCALVAGRHVLAIQDTTTVRADNQGRFATKESRRWLDGAERAAELVTSRAACVTVIADREGDIYEEFACKPAGVEVLIRAGQDRALTDG